MSYTCLSLAKKIVLKTHGNRLNLKCIRLKTAKNFQRSIAILCRLNTPVKPSISSIVPPNRPETPDHNTNEIILPAAKMVAIPLPNHLPLIFISKTNELIDLKGLNQEEIRDKISQNIKSEMNANKILEENECLRIGAIESLLPKVEIESEHDENKPIIEIKKKPIVQLLDGVSPQDLEWTPQIYRIKDLPKHYMKLSKIRLTGLVALTSLAGYGIAPGVVEPMVLLYAIAGTGLTSCAANTINQFLEIPYDSQMNRTKNRILVKGILSPLHAVTFAGVCAISGVTMLALGVSPIVAALGAANLILYTSVYTPMKRISILNTWIGSVVGAIPPVMGWVACTGQIDAGALLLAGLLFSWQFPHFNALSWNLRPDYSRAGYRMMSVTDPDLCRRVALRHSVAILVMSSSAPLVGLTDWMFAIDSLPLNAYLVYCSWQFYQKADAASSRKLFRLSLVHLPVLLMLMFISKKYKKSEKKGLENGQ